MVFTEQMTVGEIAAANPSAASVFEKYQIDYCCGGQKSLAAACEEMRLSPAIVLEEVEQAAPESEATDWTTASLAELADHIVARHHSYLRTELPALSGRLAKVATVHGARYGETLGPLRDTFEGLHDELISHMFKEEVVLFPWIKRMEEGARSGAGLPHGHCGSIRKPIGVMEHDHDNAGAALAEMRRLTDGYTPPPDGCTTFRALYEGLRALEEDLHRHIHLENNFLFVLASRLEERLLR